MEECNSILVVEKHWDGKRAESSAADPTSAPSGSDPINSEMNQGNSGEIKSPENSGISSVQKSNALVSIGKSRIMKILNQKRKKVKLTVKKIKEAKGYQIAYSTSKKFKKKKTVTSKKTTVTIKNLKKKTYYFKVRAYCVNNGEKQFGKWSKVKKIKIRR